jgi:chaperonin GroES
MNTMQPLGDRLLVVPQEKEPVTSGGVILPTEVSSVDMGDAVLGQVVALGEDVDIDVKVGQMVMYNKQQITEVPVGTSSVVFVSQNSIAAVLS